MLNSLQFRKMKFSSEFTDQNSLAQALLTKPEISNTLAYVFGREDKFHLSYLTQGSGRVSEKYKLSGNEEYMWPLMGQLTKSVAIAGSATPSVTPGINFTPFKVTFEDKYFALGDKVRFNSGIQARVQTDPVMDGNFWVYTLVILHYDPTAYIPATDLKIGNNVAWAGTAFEEGSKGGSSKKATPMWFKNQMTTSRMKWGMTGSARTDVMVLEMSNPKTGKKSAIWMYEEEYQQIQHWNRITELDRWWSVYNRTSDGKIMVPGTNGRPVKTGAGLVQQLSGTNSRDYNTLSESFLRDFLVDLQIQSKDAQNKKLIMFTGADGLRNFDNAIKAARATYTIVDTHFVSKNGADLQFGNSFTSYKGLMGTEITVVYNPLQDDKTFHTAIDPVSNLPVESASMYFLDFGDYEGESNISLIAKGADGINRSFVQWYVEGSTSYMGGDAMKKVMKSNDFDGFECNYLSETSLKVTNPLGCGVLRKHVILT